MIYKILRPLAALALTIYFRKIYLTDAQHLPKRGPVILACNHPSAFMEACLLACFLPRPLYFLTRGDFFTSRLASWFLRNTHQIPIYRARDGFGNLRSNKETFEECFARLAEGKSILMFPEARTILEKRLRPIQKGAARIGLGAMERHPGLKPVIVPIGVTYIDPRWPGGDVNLKLAQPIALDDYASKHETQPQEAVRRLTEDLENAMQPLIVHLDDIVREQIFDIVMPVIERPVRPFPVVSRSGQELKYQQGFAGFLNDLDDHDVHVLAGMITAATDFGEILRPALQELMLRRISVSPGLPLYLAGRLVNAPTELLMDWVIRRWIRAETFKGPVRAVAGFLICGIYYLIIMIVAGLVFGPRGFLAALVVVMIGYFAVANARMSDQLHWLRWKWSNRNQREQIRQALAPAVQVLSRFEASRK